MTVSELGRVGVAEITALFHRLIHHSTRSSHKRVDSTVTEFMDEPFCNKPGTHYVARGGFELTVILLLPSPSGLVSQA